MKNVNRAERAAAEAAEEDREYRGVGRKATFRRKAAARRAARRASKAVTAHETAHEYNA
jgi:hypothetical protein